MAWYKRSYFKYLIIIIILILLQDFIIIVNCVNLKIEPFLKEIKHGTTIFKTPLNVNELYARLAFDKSVDYIINNPNPKLNICKFLDVIKDKNLLKTFNKRTPFNHPHCFLGNFDNFNVLLQLTHQEIDGFKFFSKTDLLRSGNDQFISENLYFYPNYEKVFLNLSGLNLNEKLNQYQNYKSFLPNKKMIHESEFFINNEYEKLVLEFKQKYNLK